MACVPVCRGIDKVSKNAQIPNIMKTPPVEAELFQAGGQTDRHDEANIRFSQFCERAQKCRYTYFTITVM
jgi:hypothetical protein